MHNCCQYIDIYVVIHLSYMTLSPVERTLVVITSYASLFAYFAIVSKLRLRLVLRMTLLLEKRIALLKPEEGGIK